MRMLGIEKGDGDRLSILCLGAHSDDIEIGCGGTILQLSKLPTVQFLWVVMSAAGPRGEETRKAAKALTSGRTTEVVLNEFRDGFMPYNGAQIKDFFEDLKTKVAPDVIFTHWHGDAHQDHRLICELTRNTFRNHMILEYEIPKYDGDMGQPNLFVPLEKEQYEQKIECLMEAFGTQRSKSWFQRETFLGLMRLRGVESNAPSGYAEAFHTKKLLMNWGFKRGK